MSRIKVLCMSLLAVFAVSSVAAATASAELQGPWFQQRNGTGGKQVKLALNKEMQVKGVNETAFRLKGKLAGSTVVIECATATNKEANIWNGLHQGEDNATIEFTKCTLAKAITCQGIEVEVEPAKVYSELQWKYAGNTNELKEAGGQQKIYDVFAPTTEPTGGKATFTSIIIKKTLCEAINGSFPVVAAGTATKFVDQNNVEHNIVWGTSAQTEPQNMDAKAGNLTWALPNVKELHHQNTQTKARLLFGTEPAELEGKIRVELNNGEEFGVFNL